MRLLRLKIFQETACYQKPFAFKVGETYPLAPFSTVKGMLHSILEATEYIPMNLSIQGKSESIIIDYSNKFMFKKASVQLPLNMDGLVLEIEPENVTTMPMYQHLLYNIEHVIHVETEESVLKRLYENLTTPTKTLSLGRWEDLVRIDEVCFVEAEETNNKVKTQMDLFVPRDIANQRKDLRGDIVKTYYRLTRKYEIIRGKRVWDYIPVAFLPSGQTFINPVLFDSKYPVFLMKG